MSATVAIGDVQQAIGLFSDGLAAYQSGFRSASADEALVVDAIGLAALFDPALAPVEIAAPLAAALIAFVIANNTQGQPGSQTPMPNSGGRGGIGDGSAIP